MAQSPAYEKGYEDGFRDGWQDAAVKVLPALRQAHEVLLSYKTTHVGIHISSIEAVQAAIDELAPFVREG